MAKLPSDESPEIGRFDRFAAVAAEQVAKARFFIFAVVVVVVWLPTLFLLDISLSQLIINTVTTIGTWLLLSLLHNTTSRAEKAAHEWRNAVAAALADFFSVLADELDVPRLAGHAEELRKAVGLEERVSS